VAVFLGIDYGSRRIGLAVSDGGGRMALPLTTVAACGDLAAQVAAVLSASKGYDIHEYVIGLPLNMDDSEGPQARLVRRFGDALMAATGKPVRYFDERLSSRTAEELLQPAELTRGKKKKRLDRVAAQVVLQGFLDTRS
jgi:putative Holliday junction resolvase